MKVERVGGIIETMQLKRRTLVMYVCKCIFHYFKVFHVKQKIAFLLYSHASLLTCFFYINKHVFRLFKH